MLFGGGRPAVGLPDSASALSPAGRAPRRLRAGRSQTAGRRGGDRRAARLHLRPLRAIAGRQREAGFRLHRSAAGAGFASRVRDPVGHTANSTALRFMAACSGMSTTRKASCGWRARSNRSSTNACAACTWIGSGSPRKAAGTIRRNTLAAHVIGAVDGEEAGQWGLEKSLEADLRGLPGTVRVLTDAKGRGIDSQLETEPRPVLDLTLTIDERIQLPAQDAIARAVQEAHAESGSVVVMNPYHGDILAMASYPSFDPNQPPARGEKRDGALQSCRLGAVRAGLGLQGHHAFGRARNHQLAARHHDQLRQRQLHAGRPHDARSPSRLRHHAHGDGAGEIEQHRRHPDRAEGGFRPSYTNMSGASASARARASRCRRNRPAWCASWRSGGRPR